MIRKKAPSLLILLILFLHTPIIVTAQSVDYSDCPTCTDSDIGTVTEIMNKYQGIHGINPSAPSTYGLIGKHKFSGSGLVITNPFWGENWYPIRIEKQILTGTFHSFGVANFGDESDWNIHLLPDPGFEDFVSDAIPYQLDNWYGSGDWGTTADGKILIEAEITPDESRYGNPWFNNSEVKSPLVNKRLTVYGPFLREEAHGNHPEIHPCEQIWWKETEEATIILLLNDDSNRFKRRADSLLSQNQFRLGDYSSRRVTTWAYQPWTRERRQEAELSIPFEINPAEGGLFMGVQAIDNHNFFDTNYPDVTEGNKYTITYKGNSILSVQESATLDRFTGVTFRNVCFNSARGTVQGYVVLKTAVGNGDGKEGFVALRIDKKKVGVSARPTIVAGDIANTWKPLAVYDDKIAISDIISSDMRGEGRVDGMIDFNGNGKSDFFASIGERWMVLYDGAGTWQEINNSSISVDELRFGDINGDRVTDIIRVSPNKKVEVSYGGKEGWTVLTDAGEQNLKIQVGDFNGDEKTDIVYVKVKASGQPPNFVYKADMYIKYSGQGSWKKLNNDYRLSSVEDYKNFRFGNFNGDKITDIFRYHDKKFKVYYNGQGDVKELSNPGTNLKIDDLVFVDHLSMEGFTDIIHVNQLKQWTVYYGGKPGSLPLNIKYGDPATVRFAYLDSDPAQEPFAIDFIAQSASPVDENIVMVPKVKIQSVIMSRYVHGSLKRVMEGNTPALTISMELKEYSATVRPGRPVGGGSRETVRERTEVRERAETRGRTRRRETTETGVGRRTREAEGIGAEAEPREVSEVEESDETVVDIQRVTEQLHSRTLNFNPASGATALINDGVRTIGVISDVPLKGATENFLHLTGNLRSARKKILIPRYAITAIPNSLVEVHGTSGTWQDWKKYLLPKTNAAKASLLNNAPANIEKIKNIKFELLPVYAAFEDGKVRLVEEGEVANELNAIAYSDSLTKVKTIFANGKVFTISWKFELMNLTNGEIIPLTSVNAIISNGKWQNNKVNFSFPDYADVLEFKAIATIKDEMENTTVEPLEFKFYNQRMVLTDPGNQIENWLQPMQNISDHKALLTKARYLGDDKILSPSEVLSLLK